MRELRLLIYYPNCEAQAATINCAYGRCILPQQFISTEQPSRAVFLIITPRRTRVRTNDFACGFLSVATVGWCIDSPIFTRLTWLSVVNYDDPSVAGEACLKNMGKLKSWQCNYDKKWQETSLYLWDLPCFNNNWDICLFSLELRHILDANHLWSQNQLTAYKNITRQCKCLRTGNFFYWLGMTKPALHYMQGVVESLHFNKMTFL